MENQEKIGKLGKFIRKIREKSGNLESSPSIPGKLDVKPKKRTGPRLILVGKLGKFDWKIRKIFQIYRKISSQYYENSSSILGKFLQKNGPWRQNKCFQL